MEGVAPDERIVLAGQMLVRPGGKVRVAASLSDANSRNNSQQTQGGQS